MKADTKITILNDENEKFFGDGPCRLFRLIDEYGSLRSASIAMNMSYSKAFRIIRNAEQALGFPVTVRKTGGRNGGGSELTARARAWLSRFERYREACTKNNEKLFAEYFPLFQTGAVIMASGLGRRFGGNKLLADFRGRPLIASVLDTVSGVFDSFTVITRSPEVYAYVRSEGFPAVLHQFPGRNDTIRLGLSEMPETVQGCVFFQGDQPLLKTETVFRLLETAASRPDRIIRSSCHGNPSSPVYFPRCVFEYLLSLPEGKGGSFLFSKHPDKVLDFPVEDPEELKDIDTREDLRALAGRNFR